MTWYFIEAQKARSGRSTCRACKLIIEKGALRIADSYEEDHFQNHPWHHVECLTKVSKRWLDGIKLEDIKGWDELNKEDRQTVNKVLDDCLQTLKEGKPKKAKSKAKTKKKATSSDDDEQSPQKPKPPQKSKKSKPSTKSSAKTNGYTTAQFKTYQKYCQEFGQLTSDALKELLALNNQPKTGNKTELIERCADGKLLGSIPRCPECGGGRLRFDKVTGDYKCPGYMEDVAFRSCNRKFGREEIQRDQWQEI